MAEHCWHKAKDPRCEGFPVPAPVYRDVFARYFGGDDDMTADSAKVTVERKMTWVCCRCNETSAGVQERRFLFVRYKERLGPKPPPCNASIKVVEEAIAPEESP